MPLQIGMGLVVICERKRLIEERDVKGIIEVPRTKEFYRKAEGFRYDLERMLMRKARKPKRKDLISTATC